MKESKIIEDFRPKILIVYGTLLEYRVPIFSELGKFCDLTVSHSGQRMTNGGENFEEVILPMRKVGRFHIQKGLRHLIRDGGYDTVIFFMDIAWPMTVLNFLWPAAHGRRVTWGLWSTGRRFADKFRLVLAKRADHNLFYSTGAAQDFVARGLPKSRASVARNTVRVHRPERNPNTIRDSFLVVGSFNARKQNDVTLAAFIQFCDQISTPVRLVFVGDGRERKTIGQLAEQSPYADRIEFHPACHDEEILRGFYDKAICSISNGQAGLSVLQSFAYGVPFVTSKTAISGGEIENITSGKNGFLTSGSQQDLTRVMQQLVENPDEAVAMGTAALDYYGSQAQAGHMVAGFFKAIDQGLLEEAELQKIGDQLETV